MPPIPGVRIQSPIVVSGVEQPVYETRQEQTPAGVPAVQQASTFPDPLSLLGTVAEVAMLTILSAGLAKVAAALSGKAGPALTQAVPVQGQPFVNGTTLPNTPLAPGQIAQLVGNDPNGDVTALLSELNAIDHPMGRVLMNNSLTRGTRINIGLPPGTADNVVALHREGNPPEIFISPAAVNDRELFVEAVLEELAHDVRLNGQAANSFAEEMGLKFLPDFINGDVPSEQEIYSTIASFQSYLSNGNPNDNGSSAADIAAMENLLLEMGVQPSQLVNFDAAFARARQDGLLQVSS